MREAHRIRGDTIRIMTAGKKEKLGAGKQNRKTIIYFFKHKTRGKSHSNFRGIGGTMRLIRNQKGDDHSTAVREALEGADRISLAVAFLKVGGANIIVPILEKRLEQGAKAEAFIGTDFYIT